MEPWWVLVLKVFGGPLVSGLIAAGITYWLSRRRFIGERWWERKADAYGKIVGSLVGMAHSLDWWIEMVRRGSSGWMKIVEPYETARKEIERVAIEGDYVISRKASGTLRELVKALKLVVAPGLDISGPGASSVLPNDLEWRHREIEACLKVIRDEAKSDLQVK